MNNRKFRQKGENNEHKNGIDRDFRFCRGLAEQRCDLLYDAHLLFDHTVGDFNRLLPHFFFFQVFVHFIRHITHDAGEKRPLRVADENTLEVDVIISKEHLVRDLRLLLADHLHEIILIHNARDRIADDVRRILDAEDLAGSLVDLLDLQLL